MKKILTAIGNPMLNHKIKNMGDYNVLAEDIKSDEELIEWIERTDEIDILFLSSNIVQHYTIEELITIIKKIQSNILILFFKNQNEEIKQKEDDRLKIYTTTELELKNLKNILDSTIQKDIKKLTSKVIAISGASGIGKSTFSTFLAKNVENQKTLLIDFNLEESQIRTILKIKKQPQYSNNIEENIINVNKNLDVLCYLDFIFKEKSKINFFEIQKMLDSLKENYDFVIIDTSSNLNEEYTKRIFYRSDKIIFLLEPNILGIKKTKNMLEVFENDWKINSKKINLVLNKVNMYQISDSIIKELFPDLNFLGKMKYLDSYNLMINKNIDKREIKKEYQKISEKIFTT